MGILLALEDVSVSKCFFEGDQSLMGLEIVGSARFRAPSATTARSSACANATVLLNPADSSRCSVSESGWRRKRDSKPRYSFTRILS